MPSEVLENLNAIAGGIWQVATWPTPAYLLVGVAIGYVVGVLPGLSAPAALALLLPVIISLRPIDGFVLLTAVAAVSTSAGDLTSIMLGVPGEATAAAIVADGHAMARRGLAGVAAGAALTASWLGSIVGIVVFAAFVPIARPLLGAVQSPELAAIAILGLCLLIPLSRAHPIKGLAAGGFGLGLATIGLDPSFGEPRLTFGQLGLWDGLGLLPVALGLYAVPEAMAMVRGSMKKTEIRQASRRDVGDGCVETLRRPGLVVRCSAIGAAIGILPGVGASVSQWVAYAHASQTSSSATAFGTGAVEGVIGPASATTATLGGALVPTLALGIPGSVATVFLLSGLTFKGLTPGPGLLLPERAGGHLTLVWSLVWSIVLASSLGAVVSVLLLRWLQALAGVRPSRLVPFILTLIVIGTVGDRHAVGDLGILVCLGLLGYIMSVLDWPRAPLMLGFVLGPMLERRWLLSQAVYGWSWMIRPGVLVLAGLTAMFVYATARSRATPVAGSRRKANVGSGDAMLAVALALFASAMLLYTAPLAARAAAFPRLAFGAAAALSAACAWRFRRRPTARPTDGHAADVEPSRIHLARICWLLTFVFSAWLFGLTAGAALSAIAYGFLEARENWRSVVAVSAATAMTAYLVVTQLMHVADRGMALEWLTR